MNDADREELVYWRGFGQRLLDIWPNLPRDHGEALRFLQLQASTGKWARDELEKFHDGYGGGDAHVRPALARIILTWDEVTSPRTYHSDRLGAVTIPEE